MKIIVEFYVETETGVVPDLDAFEEDIRQTAMRLQEPFTVARHPQIYYLTNSFSTTKRR